jgi:hypothetical protein
MEKHDESEYIKVAALENIIEAQLIESVLKDREIPYRIRSFHDTAYDGLFQVQKGWGDLYAPETSRDDILEIINSVRSEQSD